MLHRLLPPSAVFCQAFVHMIAGPDFGAKIKTSSCQQPSLTLCLLTIQSQMQWIDLMHTCQCPTRAVSCLHDPYLSL